jgi:uncharacterized protein
MRLILILAVVLGIVWLWRSARQGQLKKDPPRSKQISAPQDMLSCNFCSVHIPSSDAIQGQKGVYCCAEHLYRAEPE